MYLLGRRARQAAPYQRSRRPTTGVPGGLGAVRFVANGGQLQLARAPLGDVLQVFDPAVEYWRPLVEQLAGDLPVNFLLAWIQRESDGNACSFTSASEASIWQLMPPDNIAAAGTTLAALRAACVGSTQNRLRQLTADEELEQVRAGIQYVNYVRGVAHAKLDAAGVPWTETSPDFWQFVKLQHAYPGPTAGWLAAATAQLGTPPLSWSDFRSTISGYATVLDNAEWVGQFGAGGGSGSIVTNLLLGGLIAWGVYRLLS